MADEMMREITADEVEKVKDCVIALGAYHNQVSTYFKGAYPRRPYEKTLESFRQQIEDGISRIAVIELDGKAAGFCKIDRKDGQGKVDYLMVLEACRGRGFGRELMDWAMKVFAEEKISLIEVKVVEGNPAIHLYEKYGFRVNAQLMWKCGEKS